MKERAHGRDVTSHEHAALSGGEVEQRLIGEAAETCYLRDRNDVVAVLTQPHRDSRLEVLIEEQAQGVRSHA